MKRSAALLASLGLLVALSGCGLFSPPGDSTTESREIGDVIAVELAGGGDLVVTVGSTPSLEITAGENVIDRIGSDTDGSTLRLGPQPGVGIISGGVRYELTVTSLESLEITGGGDATVDFAGAADIDLDIDGSGSVVGTNIDSDEVDIEIAGSGDVELEGETSRFALSINGSGEYSGDALKIADAEVSIAGSGEVEIRASDTLDITINGSGEVRHTGDANITQNVNGAGEISEY